MAGNQSLRSKYNLTSSRATESQKTAFSSIDSDEFWGNLETLVKHLGPLVEIIEHIEQDKPMITQMFFVWRFLAYHFRVSELPIEDDYGGRIINRPMIETDLETQPLSEKEKAIANAVRVRMSNTKKVGLKDIDLAKVALKALAPLRIKKSVERLWSRMRALYKPTRSRLNPVRAKKLMMVSVGRDFDRAKKKSNEVRSGETDEFGGDDTFMDELAQSEIDDLEWLQDVDLELLPQEFVDLVEQNDKDLEIDTSEGSGKGGQSCVGSETEAVMPVQ
eukprot:jgi/Picre1/32925/NNA_008254.t1